MRSESDIISANVESREALRNAANSVFELPAQEADSVAKNATLSMIAGPRQGEGPSLNNKLWPALLPSKTTPAAQTTAFSARPSNTQEFSSRSPRRTVRPYGSGHREGFTRSRSRLPHWKRRRLPQDGPDFRHGQSGINRPAFLHDLTASWLPAIPDLHERLKAGPGVRIADVGCGGGWSAIALARAYSQASVTGYDLDEASIADAQRNAEKRGVNVRSPWPIKPAFPHAKSFRSKTSSLASTGSETAPNIIQCLPCSMRPAYCH